MPRTMSSLSRWCAALRRPTRRLRPILTLPITLSLLPTLTATPTLSPTQVRGFEEAHENLKAFNPKQADELVARFAPEPRTAAALSSGSPFSLLAAH